MKIWNLPEKLNSFQVSYVLLLLLFVFIFLNSFSILDTIILYFVTFFLLFSSSLLKISHPFLEMQAFDILEETLFLIFSIYFKDQEGYPQGLAYICCPILYLLLKGISSFKSTILIKNQLFLIIHFGFLFQHDFFVFIEINFMVFLIIFFANLIDDTPSDNTSSYRLNESIKIIEKEAITQEEKIIKRKMIDFYLEKIQCDFFNFISIFYRDSESGLIFFFLIFFIHLSYFNHFHKYFSFFPFFQFFFLLD